MVSRERLDSPMNRARADGFTGERLVEVFTLSIKIILGL
jgi:hypothetical protein